MICTRCIFDDTIPGITFDADGVCSYCHLHDEMDAQYPTGVEGRNELAKAVYEIKADGRGKEYDCIVGISGGCDSSYTLWAAKRFGLRPLAVHFDNGWNTDIAEHNMKVMTEKLGVTIKTNVTVREISGSDGMLQVDYEHDGTVHRQTADRIVNGTGRIAQIEFRQFQPPRPVAQLAAQFRSQLSFASGDDDLHGDPESIDHKGAVGVVFVTNLVHRFRFSRTAVEPVGKIQDDAGRRADFAATDARWTLIVLFIGIVGAGFWATVFRGVSDGAMAFATTTLMIVYVGLLASFAVRLRCHFVGPSGAWLVLLWLTVTKLTDIGAYFSGSLFGRTKLIPAVSPGKTVEGLLGGTALAAGVAILVGQIGGIIPMAQGQWPWPGWPPFSRWSCPTWGLPCCWYRWR